MRGLCLSSFVTIAPRTGSIHFRSTDDALQIDTPEVESFTTEILPLLDGSRNKKQLAAHLRYSRASVIELLDSLERRGFLTLTQVDRAFPKPQARLQQILKTLITSSIDPRRGLIEYLTIDPPDSSEMKFAWTSRARLNPLKSGPIETKTTGYGAGLSAVEAMAKAAAEAFEMYAARRAAQNRLRYASLSELLGEFFDPREISSYSDEQYQQRDFPYVRLSARKRIHWTRGRWLDTWEPLWLPALLTHFGGEVDNRERFGQVTTSGLATGLGLEDASVRAVCELIERDAFITTWLKQLPARRLLVDSTLDAGAVQVIRALETHGLEVRLYLLKAAIDIPVVLCLALGDGKGWPGATIGLGAQYDAAAATRKAIIELAMMCPALRRELIMKRRRIPKKPHDIKSPLDHAMYYLPRKHVLAFDFLERNTDSPISVSSLKKNGNISLQRYLNQLKAAGVRIAIKNLTPRNLKDERICVVRALATGLQPIHFGFGLVPSKSRRLEGLPMGKMSALPHPLA